MSTSLNTWRIVLQCVTAKHIQSFLNCIMFGTYPTLLSRRRRLRHLKERRQWRGKYMTHIARDDCWKLTSMQRNRFIACAQSRPVQLRAKICVSCKRPLSRSTTDTWYPCWRAQDSSSLPYLMLGVWWGPPVRRGAVGTYDCETLHEKAPSDCTGGEWGTKAAAQAKQVEAMTCQPSGKYAIESGQRTWRLQFSKNTERTNAEHADYPIIDSRLGLPFLFARPDYHKTFVPPPCLSQSTTLSDNSPNSLHTVSTRVPSDSGDSDHVSRRSALVVSPARGAPPVRHSSHTCPEEVPT